MANSYATPAWRAPNAPARRPFRPGAPLGPQAAPVNPYLPQAGPGSQPMGQRPRYTPHFIAALAGPQRAPMASAARSPAPVSTPIEPAPAPEAPYVYSYSRNPRGFRPSEPPEVPYNETGAFFRRRDPYGRGRGLAAARAAALAGDQANTTPRWMTEAIAAWRPERGIDMLTWLSMVPLEMRV